MVRGKVELKAAGCSHGDDLYRYLKVNRIEAIKHVVRYGLWPAQRRLVGTYVSLAQKADLR